MHGRAAADCRSAGAANGLMSDVLEEHLREHLGPQSGSVAQRERDLLEVGQIFRRYLR